MSATAVLYALRAAQRRGQHPVLGQTASQHADATLTLSLFAAAAGFKTPAEKAPRDPMETGSDEKAKGAKVAKETVAPEDPNDTASI